MTFSRGKAMVWMYDIPGFGPAGGSTFLLPQSWRFGLSGTAVVVSSKVVEVNGKSG